MLGVLLCTVVPANSVGLGVYDQPSHSSSCMCVLQLATPEPRVLNTKLLSAGGGGVRSCLLW